MTKHSLRQYKRLIRELEQDGKRLRKMGPAGVMPERERFHAYLCALKMIEAAREFNRLMRFLEIEAEAKGEGE